MEDMVWLPCLQGRQLLQNITFLVADFISKGCEELLLEENEGNDYVREIFLNIGLHGNMLT